MSTDADAIVADFDAEALLRTVEGDDSLAKELCRLFVQQSSIDLANIRGAVQNRHSEDLNRALHRLRGASGAVCATRLAAVADQFGNVVRKGDWQCVPENWTALQQALQIAVTAMCVYLETDAVTKTHTRTLGSP